MRDLLPMKSAPLVGVKVRTSNPPSGDELLWRCTGCAAPQPWSGGRCPSCGAQLSDVPVVRLGANFGRSFHFVAVVERDHPSMWLQDLECPSCGSGTTVEAHGLAGGTSGYQLEARCSCGLVAACEPERWSG